MFSLEKQHPAPRLLFVAALLSVPSIASAVTWTPEFSLESRYDDNIIRSPNGLDGFVTVGSPGLRLLHATDRTWCEVRGGKSFVSYDQDSKPRLLTDRASVKAAYAPRLDQTLALQYRYSRTTDPIDVDEEDNFVMRGRTNRMRGDAVVDLQRVEMSARVRDWWYQDTDNGEGGSRTLALRAVPVRNRTNVATVGYRRRELDVDLRGLSTDMGTVGVRRWHSERTVSEFEVGIANTRFRDGSSAENDLAVAAGIGRSRKIGEQNVGGRVRIGHDLTTNALAEVEALWPTRRVTARYESLLDTEAGVFREPTRTRRFGLEYRGILNQSLRLNVAGSYGQHRPFRDAGWSANLYRLSAGLSIPIRSWVYARTAYAYYREALPERVVGENIERNRVMLSLNAGAPLGIGHPIPGDPFGSWRPPLWSTQ